MDPFLSVFISREDDGCGQNVRFWPKSSDRSCTSGLRIADDPAVRWLEKGCGRRAVLAVISGW